MNSILEKIFGVKRDRVAEAKRKVSAREMRDRAMDVRRDTVAHRFVAALQRADRLNIIAEFKRASPSKGLINNLHDVSFISAAYEAGGACGISILTEEDHFQGSLDDLRDARIAVSLPLLRKDFIFDEFQIYEAAEAGADAVLLIVGGLTQSELTSLHAIAEHELGMDALVEVHSIEEMDIARSIGARLIGVNNRDLNTFETSLDVSRRLIEHAPADASLVAESGLRIHEELIELHRLGYSGFLMGETLMRSSDPAAELRKLIEVRAL